MQNHSLNLSVLSQNFSITKLPSDSEVPKWASKGFFTSISRTSDELSIICETDEVPSDLEHCEKDWKAIVIDGPLGFSGSGKLANIATIIASGKIGILAISTFDTDYFFVKNENLERAIELLEKAGHLIKK